MNVNAKYIGAAVIILAVALLLAVVPLSLRIAESALSQCTHVSGMGCSITAHIPLESYIGIGSAIALILIGSLLALRSRKYESFAKETSEKIKNAAKKLDGDEKLIYNMVVESGGAQFQSELAEKSSFGKVKVTRILDRLESKGLVERRRRGMTNMILLKT